MKIALESPDQLSDNDLECIVAIWARKSRRIVECMFNTLNAGSHSNGSKVGSRFFSFTREYLALSPSICLPRLSEYLSRIFSGLKG